MDQIDLFETDAARSMLDQLLDDSRLYKKGSDYKNLLDFVVRLRNFAPFNAMLLQMQKPGMHHAASAHDWQQRFGRTIKNGARPLLILWPFGPVALVYDVMDTEGIDAYFKREVLPHAPDAWIDPDKTKVGYEIPFNRHFYVFKPPRPLAEIDAELKGVTDRILTMIGGLTA